MKTEMLTVSSILARAMVLPSLAHPPEQLEQPTVCALGNCGRPVTAGYRRNALTTEATGEFLDCFHGNLHGWACEDCARCFRATNPQGANQMARAHWAWEDGTYHAPLINRESALAQGRPCWSDLVREVWPSRAGQRCVIILTTDVKKRLWPGARVAVLGDRTSLLFYDPGRADAAVLQVAWPRLLACLDVVDSAYALGFTKEAIRHNLFAQPKKVHGIGFVEVRWRERELSRVRGFVEFPVAILIAQRPLDYAAAAQPPPVDLVPVRKSPVQPSLF